MKILRTPMDESSLLTRRLSVVFPSMTSVARESSFHEFVYFQVSSEIKRALKETVLLDNGRRGFIFTEIGYQGSEPRWLCHICCRTIISERAMSLHISHPLHNRKLLLSAHPRGQFKKFADGKDGQKSYMEGNSSGDEQFDKSPLNVELVTDVVPGEPVPPGMEDMVEGVCQLQATIDAYSDGPLIGLEYIVELVSTEEQAEPRYICLLCEKKGDPRSVMVHLTSNALNMIQRNNENRKGINVAITKVASEIERHYGRLKPMSAEAESFMTKKYEILHLIDEKQHFRETPTTTFADLVTMEKINEYSNMQESSDDGPTKHIVAKKEEIHQRDKQVNNPNNKKIPQNIQNKPKASSGKPEVKSNEIAKKKEVNKKQQKPQYDADDDVIIIGEEKSNSAIEIGSMPSISPISSSSSPEQDSRSNSRFNSRSRNRSRSWSRPKSRGYNGLRHRSRSKSRVRMRTRTRRRRSRSSDYYRNWSPPRTSYHRHSPKLPYGRNHRSYSRSRSRSRDRRSDSKGYDGKYCHEPHERGAERWWHLPKHEEDAIMYRVGDDPAARRYKETIKKEENMKIKWEEFNVEIEKLELEMNERLKYYQSRPEKHPMYPEEWKSFWNRRYKELQQSGQDASQYDFKPEWIIFWDKRMRELHEKELADKKEELRQKLGIVQWVGKRSLSNDLQDVSPPTPEPAKDVTVNDIKNTWKALTGSDITAPSTKRSPSPWEETSLPPTQVVHTPNSPNPVSTANKNWPIPRDTGRKFYESVPPIVHCLRMLSVLENQLGSLGPRVLELLSKALVLEKTKVSASMSLLQNRDIYIMFETIKEKLRGQLMAGIVLRQLVGPTRAVIKAIDNMLTSNPLKPEVFEPVKVAGVGMVDKVAVAQQIASALVAQGKTDVSQKELEELINAVVGMAKASNAKTSAGMSSAAFFSQLNIDNSTGSSHINQILTNMIASAQLTMGINPKPVAPGPVELAVPQQSTALPISVQSQSRSQTPLLNPDSSEKSAPLSDLELKESLIKFKDLPRNEQHRLIALFKELESTQPERVEKLRDYVGVSLFREQPQTAPKMNHGRLSPFSMRSGGANPSPDIKPEGVLDKNKKLGDSEEDDDDYSYEDIYKAATENLRINEIHENCKQVQEPEVAEPRLEETTPIFQSEPYPVSTYSTGSNQNTSSYPSYMDDPNFVECPQMSEPPYPNYPNTQDRMNYPAQSQQVHQALPPPPGPAFASVPPQGNSFVPSYTSGEQQPRPYRFPPDYNLYQNHYSQY
ncbi:hypothetical protein AAG570_003628 [Ranatra chinensis]|uniref:C2H2-type domain-containing protein n=1 Tax=Ranatra chinensis TaxID=642074 RepID=A0ABD0Y494_9HEMI